MSPKYFRHLFESAAEALVSIFFDGRHADKVIEYYFKNHKKWGKRDRHFFAENVYGCVRWWNRLVAATESEKQEPLEQAHHALAAHLILNQQPLPPWYNHISEKQVQDFLHKTTPAHIYLAIPQWLEQRGQQELGSQWNVTMAALNQTADVILRTNTLKVDRARLKYLLANEAIPTEELREDIYPQALRLPQRANVFKTDCFQKGYFEVQDASSQRVSLLLNPQPGERIVDACAGAGGKSLHLAALMQNKGKIISLDIHERKLEELRKRVRRAGISLIESRWIDSTKVIKRLDGTADGLLLDVPCTGLGVLKRNPDTKWKLTSKNLEELLETQKHILQTYTSIVKPGGRCVYATCSIFPSENQNQVETFLKNNPQWKKGEEHIILPQDEGFDGFYMCLLHKS